MAMDLGWHHPVAVVDDERLLYMRHGSSSSSSSSSGGATDTSGSAEAEANDHEHERHRRGHPAAICARDDDLGHGASRGGPGVVHPPHRPRGQHGTRSSRDAGRRHPRRPGGSGPPPAQPPSLNPFPFVLPAPSTPFASSRRIRSYQSAVYYGECRLRGIDMPSAQAGAEDVVDRHRRWWVQRLVRRRSSLDGSEGGGMNGSRRRMSIESNDGGESDEEEGEGEGSSEGSKTKRRRRRSVARGPPRPMQPHRRDGPPSSPALSPFAAFDEAVVRALTPSPPPSPSSSPRRDPILSSSAPSEEVESAKSDLLAALSAGNGDVSRPDFKAALDRLADRYGESGADARRGFSPSSPSGGAGGPSIEGTWLALSRPEYEQCLGRNPANGDFLYTLGRMAFDMFRPTHLVCSIRGIFNAVEAVGDGSNGGGGEPDYVPHGLRGEVMRSVAEGGVALRTYNIVVAFTVEPHQNRNGEPQQPPTSGHGEGKKKTEDDPPQATAASDGGDYVITHPIRGVMTNYGYVLPDPKVPNRFSIWFTGGTLEFDECQEDQDGGPDLPPEDDGDGGNASHGGAAGGSRDSDSAPPPTPERPHPLLSEWRCTFDPASAPRRTPQEYARVLAARVLLGASVPEVMDSDGSLSYELRRPIGGHGLAFVDVLYLDEGLRVLRGHRDQVYVCARVVGVDGGGFADGGGEEDGD